MLGFNCLWPKLILSFLLIIAGNYKVIEKNENQDKQENKENNSQNESEGEQEKSQQYEKYINQFKC